MSARIWLTLADGTEHELPDRLTIGRDPDNDLVLPVETVSREHAIVAVGPDGRWTIEDCGSYNGTCLNGTRLPPGRPLPLRHADRIEIGSEVLLFSFPAEADDPERTQPHEQADGAAELSVFQAQVVRCLCGPWLQGASLESLPSNEQIAALLGTPSATSGVKAALRRVYAKAGLDGLPPGAKRRALCRVARTRGWV